MASPLASSEEMSLVLLTKKTALACCRSTPAFRMLVRLDRCGATQRWPSGKVDARRARKGETENGGESPAQGGKGLREMPQQSC